MRTSEPSGIACTVTRGACDRSSSSSITARARACDDLLDYVAQQYSGANVVVAVAGNVDPDEIAREAQAAFGTMHAGSEYVIAPAAYVGGVNSRRQSGSSQSHVVLGFPLPSLREQPQAGIVAAALFGEGMSSPLMHEIRERLGLVYYAACSADVSDLCGQFVIEASTTPEHLDAFFTEVAKLLLAHSRGVDAVGLERARNQIAVRSLRSQERPFQRLEDAAQDLFVRGRVRSRAELNAQVDAVSARQVRSAFERMLAAGASVAVTGLVGRGTRDRLHEFVDACRP